MDWYFDGKNLNKDGASSEDYSVMAKTFRNMYDSFIGVGFSKSETMAMLTTILQASIMSANKGKK